MEKDNKRLISAIVILIVSLVINVAAVRLTGDKSYLLYFVELNIVVFTAFFMFKGKSTNEICVCDITENDGISSDEIDNMREVLASAIEVNNACEFMRNISSYSKHGIVVEKAFVIDGVAVYRARINLGNKTLYMDEHGDFTSSNPIAVKCDNSTCIRVNSILGVDSFIY